MSTPSVFPPRKFQRRRILRIAPPAYEHAVRLLADVARLRYQPIAATIGIANGGLAPARDIAQLLPVPTYQVTARHNPTDAAYTQATGIVTYDLGPLDTALAGRQLAGAVLIVDDICGSGATFTTLLPALAHRLGPVAALHTLALCRNAGSGINPDLWVWTVDDWVAFPWERPLALADNAAPVVDLIATTQVQSA
jgi:hypoxanthine phosphoribosyltransferase